MKNRAAIASFLPLLLSAAVCGSAPLEVRPKPLLIVAAQEAKIAVKGFSFTGNTVFGDETLKALIDDSVGKSLTLAQLKEVAQKVEQFYADRGYGNVRVAVTRQEVVDGIVSLRVVEPVVGKLTIRGNKRYSESFVRRQFQRVGDGSVLNLGSLERSLLLLNEYPGLTAKASLQAGAATGKTNVIVDLDEAVHRVTGSTEFNTFGTRRSGRERLTQNLTIANLSGRGDSVAFGAVVGADPSELLFGQVRYTTPVGGKGTKLSLYGLAGDFETGQEFAVLGIKGNGNSYGLSVAHPFVKERDLSVSGEFGFDATNSELELLGARSTYDRIRSVRLGLAVDRVDSSRQGRDLLSLQLQQGLGRNFGAMLNNDPFASRLGADNRFTKLTLDYTRVQQLSDRSFFIGQVNGQLSDGPLVAGEQFVVGGVDSVRGYPQAEFLGDTGIRASLELRYTPTLGKKPSWLQGLQTAVFLDHGQISNKQPVPGQPHSESVAGVGVGLRAELSSDVFLRADVGYALSQAPSKGGKIQPYLQAVRRY